MQEEKVQSMTDFSTVIPQAHFIDLPVGRFHYLNWGVERTELSGALLLHGITSNAVIRVAPALTDRYRVYAIDMRGHGTSVKSPAGAYSLRQTADDAATFMEALNLQSPLLMGHSWGGGTSIVLASGAGSDQPAPAFSKIILEDPAWNFGMGDDEKFLTFYTKDIGRPADELRPEIIAENPSWTEADVEGKIEALQQVSREAIVSVFADNLQMDNFLPLLTKINAPTLLIRADPNSSIIPESAWDEAKRYLTTPNAAVQIDQSTHNIHRGSFTAFMQVVNDFLAD